ncbi:MAG: hypothetical protein HYW02_03185 [Deltaproteobacteria bacterium]|nr:hypothetical protein [Deltaproteobacteria bacterium]
MNFFFNHYAIKVWYRDFLVWSRYWGISLLGAIGEPVLYFTAIGFGLGAFVEQIEGRRSSSRSKECLTSSGWDRP